MLAGEGAAARVRSEVLGQRERLTGVLFGGSATARLGPIGLELAYAEGSLDPDTGTASGRDMVEGRALLGIYPLRWLAVRTGVHARGYVTAAGTQRWLFTEARGRFEQDLGVPGVRAHVELWRVIGASVNGVEEEFDGGQGGEVGLTYSLAQRPFWFRLVYSVDHSALGNETRLETVEAVSVSIGAGRR
jgi:hypothetical protein